MSKTPHPPYPSRHYRAISYMKQQIADSKITREQKGKLNLTEVDFHYDCADGSVRIRSRKGQALEYSRMPFGYSTWDLLLTVLKNAPDFIELESEGYRVAAVYRIRSIFGDSAKNQWFFITDRNPGYCIRWNPDRSFRLILPWTDDAKRKQ